MASYGGRAEGRAAFPLAESSRLTGIESRDDAPPPPHGNAAWGGTECERGVFRVKRKRERVPAKPIERHEEVVEERFRGAESSEALFHGA